MSIRVLIVDDSRQMRELIKMTLAGVADVAGECADGASALACYQETRPDWVLMDVTMEKVDGITATRQIMTADSQARILILSDHSDTELRQAALESGAREYVVKENLLHILDILGG
jgi:DNA-binding NarL/FixJ family response regulator